MNNIWNLLPQLYHLMDREGELERFLAPLQAELQSVYDDEQGLRQLQSISETDPDYLKYIARSLGWQLQAKDDDERRNECATIVDFYDLKGTPYAIRLISTLTLDKLFKKLGELWTPVEGSASVITTEADANLASLLASEGTFVNLDWNDEGGYAYHYDPLYSYIVFIRIDPDDYTYGEIRPRVKAFKNLIHTMHPAGRFCYPYFICRGTRADHYKQVLLVRQELTGLRTFDDLGFWDDGGTLDGNDAPIDRSVSTKMYLDWEILDDGGDLDDEGTWDDGLWACFGLLEIA